MNMLTMLAPTTHIGIVRDFLLKERSRCLRELRHIPRYMEQKVQRIDDALASLHIIEVQHITTENPKRELWAETPGSAV